MKNLAIISILLIFASCTQREYLVESDYNPNTDFENFDSFAFTSQTMNTDAENFLGDLNLKTDIREEVMGELEAKGYTYDPNNPDLLVTFRVFDDEFNMRGYIQENNRYWDDEVSVIGNNNIQNYTLEAGTLMVNVLDAENNQVIWTGYASGIMEENGNFDTNDTSIATAVENIFDSYDYRANEL